MSEYILEMMDISKSFGSNVQALSHVNFKVKRGEVHALIGENGAGKSTLMKILNGVYSPSGGEYRVDGKRVSFRNTRQAAEGGISFVFQELNLIPTLSALENAFLGRLETDRLGFVRWKKHRQQLEEFFSSIDFELDIDAPAEDLSIAEKQMVEIAKALLLNAKIIVMDEPTATLTQVEIEKLFAIIKSLKAKGVTVVYISHRMEEIFQICDTVTVLRDGRVIDTQPVAQVDRAGIIEKMVGRTIDVEFPARDYCPGEVLMEVADLCTPGFLRDIHFDLRKGEILGIAGLVGSGRSEIARAVFGADKMEKGTVRINGKVVQIRSTMDAKRNSIGLVPEDRKEEGLAVEFSVLRNITVTNLKKVARFWPFISPPRERQLSGKSIKELNIKTPSSSQIMNNLSGGNQQKVVLAKWLFADADILILDEPTRGIDVGAKFEIYLLMNELVKRGKSIIMISSELPEIFAMSDRILVMQDGRLKACVDKSENKTPEDIMQLAIG